MFVIVKCVDITIIHILRSVNTLINICTRREGKEEEFDCPRGLTLYELLYELIHIHLCRVCISHNVCKSEKCLKFSSTYEA